MLLSATIYMQTVHGKICISDDRMRNPHTNLKVDLTLNSRVPSLLVPRSKRFQEADQLACFVLEIWFGREFQTLTKIYMQSTNKANKEIK